MGDHESREFPNPYQDFDTRQDLTDDGLETDFLTKLNDIQQQLLRRLENDPETFESHDTSVYTGTCGVAYMYWRLSHVLPSTEERKSAFDKCLRLVKEAIAKRKQKRTTFLCGDAGPLALGAVIYRDERAGRDERKSTECIQHLRAMSSRMIDTADDETPDELLYGRVGYLFALLFVRKHLGNTVEVGNVVGEVVDAVLRSGQRLAREERSSSPLMYQWHDRHYIGAAHGISGICAMLLQTVLSFPEDLTLKSKVEKFVKPTMEFLIENR